MAENQPPTQDEHTSTRTAALVDYAESAIVEDDALIAARGRAAELGTREISPAVGATLSLLARLASATSVVEIGTGVGVSGLWLLNGMGADGVLTTIDTEPEHHRAAREAFAAAAIAPGRTRLINGRAGEVLPRLSDATYDVVFINGAVTDQPKFVREGLRMVRPGGVIVVNNACADGGLIDPASTTAATQAAREAAMIIAEDDRLLPVVLPLGTGILAAAKAPAEPA